MADITLEDVTSFAKDEPAGGNILRILNSEFSIRKGKFGPYAFYQRVDMPKPTFMNIKKFKESFSYCNEETLIKWLCETYNICRQDIGHGRLIEIHFLYSTRYTIYIESVYPKYKTRMGNTVEFAGHNNHIRKSVCQLCQHSGNGV